MRPQQPSRKARLRAALALTGQTVEQFCDAIGVTRQHLYATLRDERESQRLLDKIDAFIAEHLPASAA